MKYKFYDLVDIEKLQTLLDHLYEATGIAAGIIDIDGTILTRTGWIDLCAKYNKANPLTEEQCIESVNRIPHLLRVVDWTEKKYVLYRCANGLMHAAAPIVIEDHIVAAVYKTQFFMSEPDLDFFREQAHRFGFDLEKYLEAVNQVPIISEAQLDRMMKFFAGFAQMLGELGYKQLKLYKEQEITEKSYEQLIKNHQELTAAYEEVAAMEEELRTQLDLLVKQEEKLQWLAFNDKLTGLPNRAGFVEHLSYELIRSSDSPRKGAILYLDIDNFKEINDLFGHAFGDEVLKEVAESLKQCVGSNCIVARSTGDEFAILMKDIDQAHDAVHAAENILELFRSPWKVKGYGFYMTCSIGIAMYPNDGTCSQTLLKSADTAMYHAKSHGKDHYELFNPSMNEAILKKMKIGKDIRNAIQNGEMFLVYQPQIDSKTGKIECVEALLRWNHPEEGMISPAKFIPYAEETGFITTIGEWVLRKACEQNKLWQDKGYDPVSISVNISALQLQHGNFIETVKKILRETGLDPKYLELEITESKMMESVHMNAGILNELREMGINIALDDFGTGYSSLHYLQKLPINSLKIDKSFVDDIKEDLDRRFILEIIISLAHKMKLIVTAEGVETIEQLRILDEQECDRIQGYLMSKPLSAYEIEELIKNGSLDIKALKIYKHKNEKTV